jgi:hypothetical protein
VQLRARRSLTSFAVDDQRGHLRLGGFRSRPDAVMRTTEDGATSLATASFDIRGEYDGIPGWQAAVHRARPITFETFGGEIYELEDPAVQVEMISRVNAIGRAILKVKP